MKSRVRWGAILIGAGAVMIVGGWLSRPKPAVPLPKIVSARTPEASTPTPLFAGAPPAGMRWTQYILPVTYRDVVATVKRDPAWTGTAGSSVLGPGYPMCDFEPVRAPGTMLIRILPGRIFRVDGANWLGSRTFRPSSRGRTTVLVAEPIDDSWWQAVRGWLDRLRGGAAKPGAHSLGEAYAFDEEYMPRTTPPPFPRSK